MWFIGKLKKKMVRDMDLCGFGLGELLPHQQSPV